MYIINFLSQDKRSYNLIINNNVIIFISNIKILKKRMKGKKGNKDQQKKKEEYDQKNKWIPQRCLTAPLSRRQLPVDKISKRDAKTESNDRAPRNFVNIFVNLQKVPGGKKKSSSFLYLDIVTFS